MDETKFKQLLLILCDHLVFKRHLVGKLEGCSLLITAGLRCNYVCMYLCVITIEKKRETRRYITMAVLVLADQHTHKFLYPPVVEILSTSISTP